MQKQDNNTDEKKKIKVAAVIAAAVIVLALIPIIITLATKNDTPENNPDTGETFFGIYSMNASSGSYSGSSTYSFDENNVTNTYFNGEKTVTVEYTYVIAIENGERVIRLTPKGESDSKTVSYGFYTGTEERGGVLREFISINEVYYYKQ